ncbi:unnamed protein product [Rangifer tarandus platyrhynchus]|uniref:Uncharacterized protein n=2 Tax=Rangifer tarandus platyrhynchus TaxID=3082113 RepID=A0AC60A207_RANTA|nr:unnamed protein product [Rangifer tarandus platyrhynchus]
MASGGEPQPREAASGPEPQSITGLGPGSELKGQSPSVQWNRQNTHLAKYLIQSTPTTATDPPPACLPAVSLTHSKVRPSRHLLFHLLLTIPWLSNFPRRGDRVSPVCPV